MNNQLRALLIFSVFPAFLAVPSSVDIYTSTFFNINPALLCSDGGRAANFSMGRATGGNFGNSIDAANLRQSRGRTDISAVDLIDSLFMDQVLRGRRRDGSYGGEDTTTRLSSRYCDSPNPSPSWIGRPRGDDVATCIFKILNTTDLVNVGTVTCECVGQSPSTEGSCEFLALAEGSIMCNPLLTCPVMDPPPYIPPEDPRYANLPMTEQLPTPAIMPQSIIDAEIQTYYLLAKSLFALGYDAAKATCDPAYDSATLLSGWTLVFTANLVEDKLKMPGDRVPFARMMSRPSNKYPHLTDYLISIRGTMSPEEWGIDFSYNQIFGNLDLLDSDPVHRGFAALASTVWYSLRLLLGASFARGELGVVTFTGHSLGAGVANLLGHFASKQFPEGLYGPKIRVVSFGGGRSGGGALSASLSKIVYRSIEAQFDPVPQFPCDTTPGCPAEVVPAPTARDYSTSFGYSEAIGLVGIALEDLPFDFAFGGTNKDVLAWHLCAYDCWTSKTADPDHPSSCFAPTKSSKKYDSTICYYLPSQQNA